MYIYEDPNWPHFTWDESQIHQKLKIAQGKQVNLVLKMKSVGFQFRQEAVMKTITQNVLKSSEIEGEHVTTLPLSKGYLL
jgi:Fic family protein